MLTNGECINTCPNIGTYYNTSKNFNFVVFYYLLATGVCENCNSSCYSCSGPLSTQCTSCKTNSSGGSLYFYNGTCLSTCPSYYYNSSKP